MEKLVWEMGIVNLKNSKILSFRSAIIYAKN